VQFDRGGDECAGIKMLWRPRREKKKKKSAATSKEAC